ncbi:MAG: hypothetical protein RBG1_1C00001G0904 [candidate division Zixibacteria bacterium RBG-1]|nr:MAG: hypothetical protein RBG1_1C00001G0904 [candidate division Zixibacteria bacterium RBG-1]OGC86270.1 MAG: hypothetical protein A2V73_05830 [candidate division Zixibacteria bacterium RBG_19FT_COMBO_42_43]
MNFQNILFETKGGIAELILNRPPLNILNISMMREINSVFEKLNSQTELKLLVIKAAGKAFSAGVDVEEHTKEKVAEMIKTFHRMFLLLDDLEIPTLSVVQGAALGGGCELAGFVDLVIASQEAKFGQPEIKVGVFPPVAIACFPNFGLGKKVFELILTGETITAQEALQIGLVNKVYPADKLETSANEFIEKIKNLSAVVIRLAKKSWKESNKINFKEALKKTEKIYLQELMSTFDANEGLTAFLEKRVPLWKNK